MATAATTCNGAWAMCTPVYQGKEILTDRSSAALVAYTYTCSKCGRVWKKFIDAHPDPKTGAPMFSQRVVCQ